MRTGTGQLRAGLARRDITQPLGTPAGLSLTERVTEVWDSLTATVVVLDQGGARVVIAALDLVGVLAASHHAIRSAAAVTLSATSMKSRASAFPSLASGVGN